MRGASAGGGIPAAGLQQLVLDEVEGGRHRLVVGADDPGGRLRRCVDQDFQGNGLRGREGDVETGAMLVLAVPQAAETGRGAGDAPGKHLLESLRLDGTVEAEGRHASTVPAACLAVLLVVLRVVAVGLEVVDRRGGFAEAGDRGDHDSLYQIPRTTHGLRVSVMPADVFPLL